MKVKSIWRKQRTEAEQELSAGLEAVNKISRDPYSLQDTDNKRQPSQEPPKKFYSPRKEVIEDSESSGVQERITFKVISNQPNAFLTQITPQKQVQSGFEYRLFEKQNTSINASKDVQNLFKKEKNTPRKEVNNSKQTIDSYTPSINELITPKGFESKIVKSRTLNNELVSARPKLSAKPKTLITLENETCDTNSSRNGHSILTSIKSISSLNIDNKIMSSPMISPLSTKTITKTMILDSLKSIEAPKLSKESFKLLKRITSNQSKDSMNGDNEQQVTEYGMQIPDKYYGNLKSERTGRSEFKRQSSTMKLKENSLDGKVEYYRPYLKPEPNNINKSQNDKFRIKKLSQTHFQVCKSKELDRSNPMSINNLELKL